MISVVLVRSQHPGNIGAVARVMANFDSDNLILVNPETDHLSEDARKRAKHAQHILDSAQILSFDDVKKKFTYLIGTSSQVGTAFNIPRSPLLLKDFAKKYNAEMSIAIIFGSEGTGLTNEELEFCDFLITIPSSEKYRTLNLSHSVAVVLYEVFSSFSTSPHEQASKTDHDMIEKFFNALIEKQSFTTEEKRETQKLLWPKIIKKAMLTKREAFAILGFLKKLLNKR